MSFRGSVASWLFMAGVTIYIFHTRSPRLRAGMGGVGLHSNDG